MAPSQEFYQRLINHREESQDGEVAKWQASQFPDRPGYYLCTVTSPQGIELTGFITNVCHGFPGAGSLDIPLAFSSGTTFEGYTGFEEIIEKNRSMLTSVENAEDIYKELGLGFRKSYGGIECATGSSGIRGISYVLAFSRFVNGFIDKWRSEMAGQMTKPQSAFGFAKQFERGFSGWKINQADPTLLFSR